MSAATQQQLNVFLSTEQKKYFCFAILQKGKSFCPRIPSQLHCPILISLTIILCMLPLSFWTSWAYVKLEILLPSSYLWSSYRKQRFPWADYFGCAKAHLSTTWSHLILSQLILNPQYVVLQDHLQNLDSLVYFSLVEALISSQQPSIVCILYQLNILSNT